MKAQVYHPMLGDSCKWNCLNSMIYSGGNQPQWNWYTNIYDYKFGQDTIINTKVYKIITKTDELGILTNNLIAREDSSAKIVYFIDSLTEKVLYNFNLQIGDSINIKTKLLSYEWYFITRIDSVNTLTGFRKKITLKNNSNIIDTINWIEGIGSDYGINYKEELNERYQSGGAGYLFGLLCSWKNGQQIFQNQNFGFGCYSVGGTVGINKNLNSLIKISIFPNPTASTFTISKNTNEVLQFHLYNLIGQQVLNTTLKENETTIERNNLATGTYLFSITNASGRIIENGKLIFGE
jgi:hypothetical protein